MRWKKIILAVAATIVSQSACIPAIFYDILVVSKPATTSTL